jgi:FHS family L-fucose permease-like MFS transporter
MIFAPGIRGLGEHTKFGSSLIVMSIVGGAIAAPFMGRIADVHSMRSGFIVPLVCFVSSLSMVRSGRKLKTETVPANGYEIPECTNNGADFRHCRNKIFG